MSHLSFSYGLWTVKGDITHVETEAALIATLSQNKLYEQLFYVLVYRNYLPILKR